jgi:hypothetical protein
MFEVGMTPREFCNQYWEKIARVGIIEGELREQIEQVRPALDFKDNDLVLGQYIRKIQEVLNRTYNDLNHILSKISKIFDKEALTCHK